VGVALILPGAGVSRDVLADLEGHVGLIQQGVGRVAEAVESFVGKPAPFGVVLLLAALSHHAGVVQDDAELLTEATIAACGSLGQTGSQRPAWA